MEHSFQVFQRATKRIIIFTVKLLTQVMGTQRREKGLLLIVKMHTFVVMLVLTQLSLTPPSVRLVSSLVLP